MYKTLKRVSIILLCFLFLSTIVAITNSGEKTIADSNSTISEYDSDLYNENISTPYWKSNLIYNEIVMPYSQTPSAGKIGYGQLLYTPVKVISVKDQTLNLEYVEGVDYVIDKANRKILILEGSNIKCIDEGSTLEGTMSSSYPTSDTEKYPYKSDISEAMPVNGCTTLGGVTYTEGTIFLDHYLSVTYLYDTSELPLEIVGDNKETPFTAHIPAYMAGLRQKLESGTVTEINYLSIGDSISQGCSATGGNLGHIAPDTPQYQVQICNEIQRLYGVKVNLYNLAIGGTTSYYPLYNSGEMMLNNGTFDVGGGKSDFEQAPTARNYDFCTIAYGMNDFGIMDANQFRINISAILDKVMTDSPNCNTMLISSFPMNPTYAVATGLQGRLGSNFFDAMCNIRVWYDPVNNPNAEAKYDGGGNQITGPYSNGNVRIINMHAMGDYMMKYEYTNSHAVNAGSISYNDFVGGKKSYLELSSSNVNHPNDFIHRLYAMNIMSALYDYPTKTYTYVEQPTYTVSFNTDGGTQIASQTIVKNAKVSMPTPPTKIGYVFSGWFVDNNEYSFNTPITSDLTITAKWNTITYTITYYLDGGSINGNPATYTIESDKITLINPTKEGFTFKGWVGTNLEEASKQVVIEKGSVGNKCYAAIWEPIEQNENTQGGDSGDSQSPSTNNPPTTNDETTSDGCFSTLNTSTMPLSIVCALVGLGLLLIKKKRT